MMLIVLTAGLIYGPAWFSTEHDCLAAAQLTMRAVKSSAPMKAYCFKPDTGEIFSTSDFPK